jgi:hypothetical protein
VKAPHVAARITGAPHAATAPSLARSQAATQEPFALRPILPAKNIAALCGAMRRATRESSLTFPTFGGRVFS